MEQQEMEQQEMEQKEIIESVEYVCGLKEEFEGYKIKTNLQTMEFMIDNFQSCCESYGVDMSVDDAYLVGKKVVSIGWNLDLTEEDHEEYEDRFKSTADILLVVENNEKIFITIYNEHNGYYPHTYKVEWNGVCDTDSL